MGVCTQHRIYLSLKSLLWLWNIKVWYPCISIDLCHLLGDFLIVPPAWSFIRPSSVSSAEQMLHVTWCACNPTISCSVDAVTIDSKIKVWPDIGVGGFAVSWESRSSPTAPCAVDVKHCIFILWFCICLCLYLEQPLFQSVGSQTYHQCSKEACANVFFDLTSIYSGCWQVSVCSRICTAWLSPISSPRPISFKLVLYIMPTKDGVCSCRTNVVRRKH